jgi:hypothetical protein
MSTDMLSKFKTLLEAYPGAGLREIIRLVPDSLLLGSGLFALMTQNYPMGVLFGTLIEIIFLTVGIQNLATYLDLPKSLPERTSISKECKSGFQSPTLQNVSIFFKMDIKSAFPSAPVFILTAALSYVITAMQGFTAELSELGPAFSTRYYIGIVLSFILMFIVAMFRLLNNCDGIGIIILSILLGYSLGSVLCWQNNILWGRESTNVLGIPVFANTTADGSPIYICPTRK